MFLSEGFWRHLFRLLADFSSPCVDADGPSLYLHSTDAFHLLWGSSSLLLATLCTRVAFVSFWRLCIHPPFCCRNIKIIDMGHSNFHGFWVFEPRLSCWHKRRYQILWVRLSVVEAPDTGSGNQTLKEQQALSHLSRPSLTALDHVSLPEDCTIDYYSMWWDREMSSFCIHKMCSVNMEDCKLKLSEKVPIVLKGLMTAYGKFECCT